VTCRVAQGIQRVEEGSRKANCGEAEEQSRNDSQPRDGDSPRSERALSGRTAGRDAHDGRPIAVCLRNLENDAGSGNFFGIRWILFPDRVGFGLAEWRHGEDNRG
jgi:hypothetical protein